MDWLDTLQKALPWVRGLTMFAKIIVSLILTLGTCLILLLIWAPASIKDPSKDPEVVRAYDRMAKVLSRLKQENGQITLDGRLLMPGRDDYFRPYAAIATYVSQHPGDIDGAAEAVWEHGGYSRIYSSNEQEFEVVVSNFLHVFEDAKHPKQKAS